MPLIAKWIVAALAAVAIALPTVLITLAGVFRDIAPHLVASYAPFDGRARANGALKMFVADRGADTILKARQEARAAFLRDPTAIKAFTVAAVARGLSGDEAGALELLEHAERLSRRDKVTQLALIEYAVSRDDIDDALIHYDTILRSSEEARSLLFPILAGAINQPGIPERLNAVLRRRPIWWRQFSSFVLGASENPHALYLIHRGMFAADARQDRELAQYLLRRLADAGQYELAWRVYEEIEKDMGSRAAVLRDGTFTRERGWPPFDWQYAADPLLYPERRPHPNGHGFALYLPTAPAASGEAARQLLRMQPGEYQLRAQVGGVPVDQARRPFVRLACADSDITAGFQSVFPVSPEGTGGEATMTTRAVIPRNCPYQWLTINVRGGLDESLDEPPWIAAISLQKQ